MAPTNRELAAIILLFAVLLSGMFRSQVRASLIAVLKAIANHQILIVVGTYLLLTAWVSSIMVRFGVWSWDHWPSLSIWLLFAGFPIVFSVTEAGKQKGLFRNKAKDAIGLAAFVGFIAEVRSFPLWIEIVLAIVVTVLWIGGYGLTKEQESRGGFRWALTLVSILVFANSVVWSISNFSPIWIKEQGASFVVVTVWTFATLSYLFLFLINAVYQSTFSRFEFAGVTPALPIWKAKLAVISAIGVNVELAHEFKPHRAKRVLQSTSIKLARERMEGFKHEIHQANEWRRLKDLKLITNAGVKGTDITGCQLDQREFQVTIEALQMIAMCQDARYKVLRRFDENIIEICQLGSVKALGAQHGITVSTFRSGQGWYAFRQTVSGWYFAVGSREPEEVPTARRYYDGPIAPESTPNSETWDSTPGGANSRNWFQAD